MLDKTENAIKKIAGAFNLAAGAAIVIAMLLVVAHVIMRKVFKSPILGAPEFTGFLSVLIISFGLAYCLVVNAHIAVDFIVEKFSQRSRGIIDSITGIIAFVFLSLFTWQVFVHAVKIMNSGQLSPTTRFPFYIFIYVMGMCFLVLCLAYLVKVRESFGKARSK
ncbi:MAG: TRAP transporter small permease [Clostridia bacterium]|nr:TRAP transporter small permease [Clostridia bacterium]